MNIEFIDETNELETSTIVLIQDVLEAAAQKENVKQQAELSVAIVTNEEIQQLNKQYRNKDVPTDVLSFPLEDEFPMVEDEDFPQLLGDIIISIEKVKEQAEEYGHSFERELAFLAVHGFLHLVGYTHDNEEEEMVMFGKQEAILQEFQLERP